MEYLTEKASKLFTLPSIVFQLQELLYNQRSTSDEIGELISLDPALTARILRLANSSFYNFPSQIDTVSRAVTIVGTNEIYNLALATAAVNTFRGVNSEIIDMPKFWRHSVYTGLFARNLLTQIGVRSAEALFVAGLLHNIGLLVLLEQTPEKVNELENIAKDQPIWEKEQQILGFKISEVSAELMKSWNLPDSLIQPVSLQHTPEKALPEFQQHAACIYIALRIADHLMYVCDNNVNYRDTIQEEHLQLAGIDEENLDEAITYSEENMTQILAILSPESI